MTMQVRRKSNPRITALRALRHVVPEAVVVLVRDDEVSVARALARARSLQGAHVVISASIETARARLDDPAQPLAAVLAEMCIDRNSEGGAQVLEYALLVRPEICAMAMTALPRPRELDDRIARLQIPFAPKPVDPSVLAAFVRSATLCVEDQRTRRATIVRAIGDAVGLTDAERDTLFLLSFGLIAKQIAERMNIEECTVRAHLDQIRWKLAVHSVNGIFGRLILEALRT
jgi:DNA-binding NarL/FixJ family response regulator